MSSRNWQRFGIRKKPLNFFNVRKRDPPITVGGFNPLFETLTKEKDILFLHNTFSNVPTSPFLFKKKKQKEMAGVKKKKQKRDKKKSEEE